MEEDFDLEKWKNDFNERFSTMGFYVLDENKNPIPAKDIMQWSEMHQSEERRVKTEYIGEVFISTVFLGWDEGGLFRKHHKPLVFETMIFGGKYDKAQYRYHTWKEAELGHEAAANRVRLSQDNQ